MLRCPARLLLAFASATPCFRLFILSPAVVLSLSFLLPLLLHDINRVEAEGESHGILLTMDDDGAPRGIDGGGAPMKGSGSQSWLRDLWSSQRSSQMQMGRTTYASGSLPVFGVGPSALWWKEPHAFADYSSEDGGQEAEEAELARAAQAALEIAQVRVSSSQLAPSVRGNGEKGKDYSNLWYHMGGTNQLKSGRRTRDGRRLTPGPHSLFFYLRATIIPLSLCLSHPPAGCFPRTSERLAKCHKIAWVLGDQTPRHTQENMVRACATARETIEFTYYTTTNCPPLNSTHFTRQKGAQIGHYG